MKFMFTLISQNGQRFVEHFLKQNQNMITVEMKDSFTRFANDVIANTAFGIECDSLRERNNEFYLMGKEATDFSGTWKNIKVVVFLVIPKSLRVSGLLLSLIYIMTFFSFLKYLFSLAKLAIFLQT